MARCTAPNAGHTLDHVKPILGSICPPRIEGAWSNPLLSCVVSIRLFYSSHLSLPDLESCLIFTSSHIGLPWQKSRSSQWEWADWGSVSCQRLHTFTVTNMAAPVLRSQPGSHPYSSSPFLLFGAKHATQIRTASRRHWWSPSLLF